MITTKSYKLKDICIEITDGSHFSPVASETGFPMFSVKDMREFGFSYDSCKYISKNDFDKMKKSGCVPQKDDILVAKDGSYLKEIFRCKETKEEAVLSSIAIFRPNKEIVDSSFLCYLLKTPNIYTFIKENCVSGSALPRIILKAFKEVKVEIPSLDTQCKIAAILSAIDDKIELNNRMNENLTKQAKYIFKDFYSNIKGNYCRFGDCKNLWTLTMGQSPKGDSYNTDGKGTPLLNGAADYSNMVLSPNKYTTQPTRCCCKGDLIFCIRATIGLLIYSDKEYCLGRGVASIHAIDKYKEFIYHLIDDEIEVFKHNANGSVIVGITKDDVLNMKIKLPNDDSIARFHAIQNPLFSQIEINRAENKHLAELRDTLLPKLMSGEIDVSKVQVD